MAAFTGTKLDDGLFGSGLSDLMFDLAGNDPITGNGGADTLNGVAGDDSYVVDSAADTISDGAGLTQRREMNRAHPIGVRR